MELFLKGVIIGIAVAAPIGPISILCIQRTLVRGYVAGMVTGLGVATADALYASIAAFGLSVVMTFLVDQTFLLRFLGGIFLCYLGATTMLSRTGMHHPLALNKGVVTTYASALFITLTNPMTLITFAAIFAGVDGFRLFGLGATSAVLGVFTGSFLWALFLIAIVTLLRRRMTDNTVRAINRVSGAVIALIGLFIVWTIMR